MKALNVELELVFPPISNQEGEWLKKDIEVREYVRESKLYMIVHREELKFINSAELLYTSQETLSYRLQCGEIISPVIELSVEFITNHIINTDDEVAIEFGERIIRITDTNTKEILYWATPDKLLHDLSRNIIKVTIKDDFDLKIFSKFELYYVGISKQNDSFSRLFKEGHQKRLEILSNETQKSSGARLTDEIIILLFDFEYFNIIIVDDFKDLNYYTNDKLAVVADAEKAFINLMNTKYNEVKYINYPVSEDGLYRKGLDRYTFSINNDITIYTKEVDFNGAYGQSKKKDLILVNEETANIVKQI